MEIDFCLALFPLSYMMYDASPEPAIHGSHGETRNHKVRSIKFTVVAAAFDAGLSDNRHI
jgi:hypothetical protein